MAGYKIKSGRPTNYEKRTFDEIIDLSLHAVYQFLNSSSTSMRAKAEIGSRFVLKKIPDRVEAHVIAALAAPERVALLQELRRLAIESPQTLAQLTATNENQSQVDPPHTAPEPPVQPAPDSQLPPDAKP